MRSFSAIIVASVFVVPVFVISAFGMSAALAQAAPSSGAANETQILRKELARACEGKRALLGQQWGEHADLDGDGRLDLIIDHGGILCNGERGNITCGFRACDVVIYLQRKGRLVEVYTILSIGYELGSGRPPLVKLTGHNFEEGAVRWNGSAFVEAALLPAAPAAAATPVPATPSAPTRPAVPAGPPVSASRPSAVAPSFPAPSAIAPSVPAPSGPAPVSPAASGGTVAAGGAGTGAKGAGAGPVWRYSLHPVLGLAAHVQLGTQAFGLTCGFAGRDHSRSDPVEVRLTPDLARGGEAVLAFQSGHIGGNPVMRSNRGYSFFRGNSCIAGIEDFTTQQHLLILPPGKVMSVVAEGSSSRIDYTLIDGRNYRLNGPGGMNRVPGTVSVPLTGAAQAIGKLIAACPAIKADIDNDCGI